MKITFYGGAGWVTGAMYLLEDKGVKILVECGFIQGGKKEEKENYKDFMFDPKDIEAVFVTHAHLDHVGRIPKLFKDGFNGKVYSTAPTKDAAGFLFIDAYNLMLHQHGKSIYEIKDINEALNNWREIHYKKPFKYKHLTIEYYNAGHILGSASIKISSGEKSIVFSGDLGNMPVPMINGTDYIEKADYALVESAYGNRVHDPIEKRSDILEDVVEDTVKSGGVLLIPSFALERAQQLLFELDLLVKNKRIPEVPMFIDSPLAIKLTSVYEKYSSDPEFFQNNIIKRVKMGDEIFCFPRLRYTLSTTESKEINKISPPKVIIAGSGMSNGGRILFHEQLYLSNAKNTILFVGFQPIGSIGREIIDGEKNVKIMGEIISVKAKVVAFSGYSAHADQPLLLKWIYSMRSVLKKVFVVQGELDQSIPLADRIKDEFAIDAEVPDLGESVELW